MSHSAFPVKDRTPGLAVSLESQERRSQFTMKRGGNAYPGAKGCWLDQAGSTPRQNKGHTMLYKRAIEGKVGKEPQPSIFLPKPAAGIQAKGVWAGLGDMLLCKAEGDSSSDQQDHYSRSLLNEVHGVATLSLYEAMSMLGQNNPQGKQ